MPAIFLALLLSFSLSTAVAGHDRKVLLISLDGFRHDLLNATLVPRIHKFASERSSWFTNGVKSQMLTVTASNHMSIVSGLREDEHGVVGNYFWDRTKQAMYDKFNIAGGPDIRQQSELSECRYRAGFGDITGWPSEKGKVLDSLETNNLVIWYIAEPDSTLHGFGFENGHIQRMLGELDVLFDDLIKKMDEKGLLSKTDIILTADHGHIQVQPGKTLCVNNILGELANDSDYHAGDSNIYHSNPAKVQEMFNKLKAAISEGVLPYKVYLQKDVPAAWHYVNADRTGDIVIEPLPGGQVKMKCKSDHDDSHTSTHGQDPTLKDMRALLVLSGPSFKTAEKFSDIPENIDLFPLMLRLLGIEKTPHHSGALTHLNKALREKKPDSNSGMRIILAIITVSLMIIVQ